MDVVHIQWLLSYQKCFFFNVRGRCDVQLAYYSSKHITQFFSNQPFVWSYTHDLKTTGYVWTFSTSNDFFNIAHIPCVVKSCKRDPTEALRPQTCIGHSLIQHCVSILQASTYNTVWCTTAYDNKIHVPYDFILHIKWLFYCQRRIIL